MINPALVDGGFPSSEKELIKSVAHKLGFTHTEAGELIEQLLNRDGA
jgi:hypothetical protein